MIDAKNPVKDGGGEPALPEVEVDSKVIETDLDEPGRPKWTERKPIKPATVRSLDKDAEMQTTIEGLPKGLSFDGTNITGTPVVEDGNWDGDGGMFKTVTLKFKAKKNGKMLVRTYKYWIYIDKDRDGIADDDEDGGIAFTPQRLSSKPLVVDGKEPTLDDYKALFSNIPSDGSVKVSIKQKPDLSKKGITRAVLEFSVDGIEKNGKATVMIDVKNPVKDEAKPSNVSNENYSHRSAIAVANLETPTIEKQSSQSANFNNIGNEKAQKLAEQVTAPATAEKERMGQ